MSVVIAIYNDNESVDISLVEALLDTANCPPASENVVRTDGNVALGYRGPSSNRSTREATGIVSESNVHVTVDGRIDNPGAVAASTDGNHEKTRGARLLQRGYRQIGDRIVDSVVGPFSLCIWDSDDQSLLCARDKTGIRHLYYASVDDTVIVSSQVSPIVHHPNVPTIVNERAIASYLSGQLLRTRETFFEHVRRIRRGEQIHVSDGTLEVTSYWSPLERGKKIRSQRTAIRLLQNAFRTAIRCRVGSDKVGLMMSGGADSTTIAHLAANDPEIGSSKLQPISMVFDQFEAIDERSGIQQVDRTTSFQTSVVKGRDIYPYRFKSAFDAVQRDHPCLDTSLDIYEAIYEESRENGYQYLLTGLGGNLHDGSYLHGFDLLQEGKHAKFLNFTRRNPKFGVFSGIEFIKRTLSEKSKSIHVSDVSLQSNSTTRDSFVRQRTAISPAVSRLYRSYTDPYMDFALDCVRRLALRKGIELCHPFLDARIIELVFSIPPEWRVHNDQCKHLFHEVVSNATPSAARSEYVTNSYKPYVDAGLQHELSPMLRALSDRSRLAEEGLLSQRDVRDQVHRFLSGKSSDSMKIWRLFTIERWLSTLEFGCRQQ